MLLEIKDRTSSILTDVSTFMSRAKAVVVLKFASTLALRHSKSASPL
jgi:hypothetical protein